jgi:hypothetical protein
MRTVLEMLHDHKEISILTLEENEIMRPSPDKVSRETRRKNKVVVVPADNATAFVLKHKLREHFRLERFLVKIHRIFIL